MEDALKILIIIGSIVYAVAKKRAAKHAAEPPRPHDAEAWPREMTPESETPTRSNPDSSVHPVPAKGHRSAGSDTPQAPAAHKNARQVPGHDSRRMQQQGSAAEASVPRRRDTRTDTPPTRRETGRHDGQGSGTGTTRPTSAFEELLQRAVRFGGAKQPPIPAPTHSSSSARAVPATAPARQESPILVESDDTASESLSAAELREEFDLRRAIIYSEILKPKFEE